MKTLYISKTRHDRNVNIEVFSYWYVFRGKLYPVYPTNSLLVRKKLDNTDEIYTFYDNGKMKKLGKLGDYNLKPLDCSRMEIINKTLTYCE